MVILGILLTDEEKNRGKRNIVLQNVAENTMNITTMSWRKCKEMDTESEN